MPQVTNSEYEPRKLKNEREPKGQKSLEMNAISFEPDSIDSSTKLTSLFSFFFSRRRVYTNATFIENKLFTIRERRGETKTHRGKSYTPLKSSGYPTTPMTIAAIVFRFNESL